jgi:hypothetical protein
MPHHINGYNIMLTSLVALRPHATLQMLHYVKIQTDPDVICLSATAESALVEAAAAEAPGAGVAGRLEGYCVQLERSSVFAHDKVCHRGEC